MRLVHALHSLRVREQRAPATRVAIFFPLRPSVCRWLCPSAAPPLGSRHRFGSKPPSPRRGPVLESPGPAGRSCGPGPIVRRSVCPEAGPRDPKRSRAPTRRVKRPPRPSSGPGRRCRGSSPTVGRWLSVLLSVCVWGGGRGLLVVRGAGAAGLTPPLGPAALPAVAPRQFLFLSLSGPRRGVVRATALPARAPGQPAAGARPRSGRVQPGRPRRLTGLGGAGGGEDSVGVPTRGC